MSRSMAETDGLKVVVAAVALFVVLAGFLISARSDLGHAIAERDSLKTALSSSKADASKAKKEAETLALEFAAMRQVAKANGDDLDACRKEVAALPQPCPGPCGISDCRFVRNVFEGYLECLEGVHRLATEHPP